MRFFLVVMKMLSFWVATCVNLQEYIKVSKVYTASIFRTKMNAVWYSEFKIMDWVNPAIKFIQNYKIN